MAKVFDSLTGEWVRVKQERAKGKLIMSHAIRYHCIDCMGFNEVEVSRCANTACPLWEYRMGKYTPYKKDHEAGS